MFSGSWIYRGDPVSVLQITQLMRLKQQKCSAKATRESKSRRVWLTKQMRISVTTRLSVRYLLDRGSPSFFQTPLEPSDLQRSGCLSLPGHTWKTSPSEYFSYDQPLRYPGHGSVASVGESLEAQPLRHVDPIYPVIPAAGGALLPLLVLFSTLLLLVSS